MSNSYFMSVVLHVGLFVAALLVTPPLLEKLEDKEITVEIIETPPVVSAIDAGAPVKVEAAPLKASSIAEAKLDEEIKAPKSKPVKAPSKKSVQTATLRTPKVAAVASRGKSTPQPTRAGVPETLEDIQAPDLDFEGVDVARVGSLNENELDNEFQKVDAKSEASLSAQKAEMDNDLKSVTAEADQEFSNLENENKQSAQVMSESLNATRTKNAAILAKIKAGEAAEAARNARLAGLAKAAADKAAAAGRVRALENLRQLNGNPKPQYSMDERFRKEQGTVVFQAFVTNQGSLKDFKLVRSTGFKNLDGKTLAALKKWRFYPGQEGWVEIPQTWNIKGEAEEMPATLRRKISQR